MTSRTLLRFASLIFFTIWFTGLTYAAGPQRTFVSAQRGDDANTASNCSVSLPCRNFNAAIGVVNAGGEVVALDSGGYGQSIINKAVTLTGPTGVYVAITAQSGVAITVSALSTDTVVLRGLTLTGLGGGSGISVTSVGNLHVEGCVISGFTAAGINVNLTADGSQIFVKDTITRNNGNVGIEIRTNTGIVKASIDNCRSERNLNFGFYAGDNSRMTINRSVATGQFSAGFLSVTLGAGSTSELSCEECVSSNNGVGFLVNGSGVTATVRISNSTATNNNFGFRQLAGAFRSLDNNLVAGNATDIAGTITLIPAL